MTQYTHEGTPQQLAAWLGQLPDQKRYRLVAVEEAEAEAGSTLQVKPNEGMIAALREIAKRQSGRRHTEGSETDRLLREARAGAMWGQEPSE